MKKILPLIVAILFSNALSAQLPLTGLQSWYPLCNGTSLDQSGNGFDFTNSGAVADTDRFGNPNTALLFNGGTSSLAFLVPFAVSVTTNAFTYSCWIYPNAAQSSVIWYNGNPNTDGFGLYMNNGTLGLPGTNVEVVFGGAIGQYVSTAVTLNAWHHLLLTKIGGAYHLYIDGADHGFVAVTPFVTPSPASQFTVGQDYTAPGLSAFSGKIDDIAVYNQLLTTADTFKLDHFNPDVAPFTFGNLLPDTTICSRTLTLTPSPAFDTSNYVYSWSTGGTSTTTAVTVIPPGVPGANYTLTISTKPALYGCPSSYTLHVHHLNVGVDIGPRDTTFCVLHGIATLNPSPVPGETYTWNTGDISGSLAVTTPGTYWVVVDSAGCTGTDTIGVHVQDTVIVNLGIDTSSCDGTPITLTSTIVSGNITGVPVKYTWGWDIVSPPLAGITTNPTYTVTISGVYWVADTIGKCFGVDTVKVGVVYDTLHLYNPDTAVCKDGGGVVQVRAHGNPFATNLWTPTAGVSSSLSVNPLIAPDTSAWYKITASLFGCSVSDSFYIDVQPKPTVYVGGNRSVCRGDTIHIHAIVTPSWYTHYVYYWSPGGNLDHSATTVGDSDISTIVFTAGDSTGLVLLVRTPLDSADGKCRAVDSAQILVHTPHATAFTDTSICPGDSVLLNPNPLAQDQYEWHPGIYLSDSTIVHPLAKPITTQFYWIRSTDQYGCHDTMTQNIKVLPGAVIDIGDSIALYPGETYQISPQTNCITFAWRPPLGLSDTAISNPIAAPVVNTKYIVRASTEWGCYTMDSINIRVDPATLVALPNAFTPGNGVNSYLSVLKRGIAVLNYIRIFNRWGNVVYESKNIDAGWDGTFNGKPQPMGVYVYDLEAVTNRGVVFHKTGNVTLIR